MPGAAISKKPPANTASSKASSVARAGFELVPLIRRPIFLSPPLMFCFKGCQVGIPCGRCRQMVRPNKRNAGLIQEDLITQLSNHYLLNFWISETVHTSFFQEHPQLNRQACCIVCQKTFDSIPRVLRHVREIVLDLTLRSRCYHWLILENVTNLFVNRDIGFVQTDQELISLLGKLFPQYPNIAIYGRPSFTQIFQSLRSVIEAASSFSVNAETANQEFQIPSFDNCDENESHDSVRSESTIVTSGCHSAESTLDNDFVVLGSEEGFADNFEVLSENRQLSSGRLSNCDSESFSVIGDTTRSLNEGYQVGTTGRESEIIETDLQDDDSEISEEFVHEEIEITWVTHHERVTRWISMRPVGSHELRCHEDTMESSDADVDDKSCCTNNSEQRRKAIIESQQCTESTHDRSETPNATEFYNITEPQPKVDESSSIYHINTEAEQSEAIIKLPKRNERGKLHMESEETEEGDKSSSSETTYFEELQVMSSSSESFSPVNSDEFSDVSAFSSPRNNTELPGLTNRTYCVNKRPSPRVSNYTLATSSSQVARDIQSTKRVRTAQPVLLSRRRKSHFENLSIYEENNSANTNVNESSIENISFHPSSS